GRHRVVALVVPEAEGQVGVHRVEPAILERVGAYLVAEANSAPLLTQIEEEPARLGGELLERHAELVAAIAAERPEGVAGEALGVEARQDVVPLEDVAVHQ